MLNWRHEQYRWVPCIDVTSFGRLSFDARALVTYLAKFADEKGVVPVVTGTTSLALAVLIGVPVAERQEFCHVVREALKSGAIVADENAGTVTIPRFNSWQRTLGRRRRLFCRETPAFARLSAFARMYAAEFVRVACDDGMVAKGSPASMATDLSQTRGRTMNPAVRDAYRNRLYGRVAELCAEGFLVATDTVKIRNFVEAQESRAVQDERRTGIVAPARAPKARAEGEKRQGELPDPTDTSSAPTAHVTATSSSRHDHFVDAQVAETTQNEPCLSSPTVSNLSQEKAREPSYEGSSAGSPTHANATDSSPAVNPPSPIPSHAHGAQPMQSTLPFDADAPTTATDAPAVPADASQPHAVAKLAKGARKAPAKGSAEKAPKTVKAKRPKKELADGPMPFTVEEALAALAATARGKFVVGSDKFWHPFARRNITANIRRFPDIATWSIVGEYLAATHTGKAWTPNWAASGFLGSEVILAMAWHDEGRPTNTNGRYAPPAAARPSLALAPSSKSECPFTNDDYDVNYVGPDPFTDEIHKNARRA